MISKCYGTRRKRKAVDFLQSWKRTFITFTAHSHESVVYCIIYVRHCKAVRWADEECDSWNVYFLVWQRVECIDVCCILFHLLKGLHFTFPGEAGNEIATGQGMETNQFFRNARLLLFKILETSMYLQLLPDPKSIMMVAPSELSQYPRKLVKASVSLDLTKMLPFEILLVWKAIGVSTLYDCLGSDSAYLIDGGCGRSSVLPSFRHEKH